MTVVFLHSMCIRHTTNIDDVVNGKCFVRQSFRNFCQTHFDEIFVCKFCKLCQSLRHVLMTLI